MKQALLPILFCSLLPFLTVAQSTKEDLSSDLPFFKEQSQLYQRWLDKSGFSKVIKVHTIEVDTNLALYLSFPSEDPDSCRSQWIQLQKDYAKNNSLSLDQALFYKLIHMMEVRPEQANIQMYDIYDIEKDACYLYAIYSEGEKVLSHEEICRNTIDIKVEPYDLDGLRQMSEAAFKQSFRKTKVYNAILNYAQKRYSKKTCDLRNPEVRELERGEVLRFEVIDLCKEVLEDEDDSNICGVLRFFGRSCNWIKREKLEYTITFEPAEEEEGFNLGIEISGKYGSGYYKQVKRGGYLDMELDFEEYLDAYTERMKVEFQKVINQLKE